MKDFRISSENGWLYPLRRGTLGIGWMYYYTEEILWNGMYSTTIREKVRFKSYNELEEFIRRQDERR